MSIRRLSRAIAKDARGASVVEFALLAPLLLALMFGVVSVGVYMQNSNALRSLASDASRFATVEYQKDNAISAANLERNIKAMGISSPYFLSEKRLTVSVTEVGTSRVNGAREFDLDLTYDLPDLFGGTSIDDINLTYSRPLFVLDS